MKISWLFLLYFWVPFSAYAQSLRVVTEDLPPYQVVVDNQLIGGSSYDVVVALLNASGIKTKIEVLPWARAYSIALNEPNTLIFSMARTTDREPHFHWLLQLNQLHYHFYYSSNRPKLRLINSLPEMLDHSVATVRNSVEAYQLMQMGFVQNKNLFLTLTYQDAWEMVRLKRVDFTYASSLPETAAANKTDLNRIPFVQGFDPQQSLPLYIAVSKNTDEKLLHQLNSGLTALHLLHNKL